MAGEDGQWQDQADSAENCKEAKLQFFRFSSILYHYRICSTDVLLMCNTI